MLPSCSAASSLLKNFSVSLIVIFIASSFHQLQQTSATLDRELEGLQAKARSLKTTLEAAKMGRENSVSGYLSELQVPMNGDFRLFGC